MLNSTRGTVGFLESRKGKCKRCKKEITGPPNKRYCDDCRKAVTKERFKK